MAGWDCRDGEKMSWIGTVEATNGFIGDGSKLTNIPIITTFPTDINCLGNISGATIVADNGFTGTITAADLTTKTITISGGIIIGFA